MNLHLLRIFVTVADHMSFSRAADALFISQPAVSKAVRELESHVGQRLFERGGRRLRLTDAGALLCERGRTIFAVERTAEEDLAALGGLQRGVLRVGASTTIATYLLPSLLARFHYRYPGVELHLTSLNTLSIARRLLNYEFDVALVEGPVGDPHITCQIWREDELVVIAAPAHPFLVRAGSEEIPVAWLVEEVFLVREPGSGTREVAEEALQAHGVHPARTIELGSTEAIKQAVAAGLGLGIVSAATIADQVALGKLAVLPVRDLAIRRTLNLLRLSGRTLSPLALAFESLLMKEGGVAGPGAC